MLLDTGAMLNIVSSDLVKSHGLSPTGRTKVKLKFAGGNEISVTQSIILTLTQDKYERKIEFLVAAIHIPMILGTPWFSSVSISNLTWEEKRLTFVDLETKTEYSLNPHPPQVVDISYVEFVTDLENQEFEEWGLIDVYSVSERNQERIPIVGGSETQKELDMLIEEYEDIFRKPKEPPPSRPEDHSIVLKPGHNPPLVRGIGRLSEEKLVVLKNTIQDLLEKGFIRPSNSPFGASVLFAKKSDGSLRLCVDYRGLNEITEKDRSPLPHLGELRDRVSGSKVFSSMDLRDGFYNILVREEDRYKTAFRTRYGLYEFNVLPMGLSNSPATMQATMNRIFGIYYDIWLLVYLDDLLVYSEDSDTHLRYLRLLFSLLRNHRLYLKREKCKFLVSSVRFCGHILSSKGFGLNVEKLPSLDHTPPSNSKEVQRFLGLINWFREFIPNCAEISRPLSNLTRKSSQWKWGKEEANAFQGLLTSLHSAPVLKHFEPKRQTYLYTDASNFAVGGWIGQENTQGRMQPVVYYSRKMNEHELKYPVHEQELLAIISMLDHHGIYLQKAIVKTDHRPLVWLQSQPFLSSRQVRWVMKLQEFNLKIEYLPGKFNNVADYLSRQPILAPKCHLCQSKIQDFKPSHYSMDEFTLSRNASGDICVIDLTDEPKAQERLVATFHDRGHQGIQATTKSLARYYSWPNMKSNVKNYVETCDICQRSKTLNSKPPGLLSPIPIPSQRFSCIGMDWFFLPKSKENLDCVMILVDYLSKYVKLIPCMSTDSSPLMASRFKENWHDLGFGIPSIIISDRDSKLTSKFWENLCNILDIKRNLATARHQQTNGQVERTIRTVKTMLMMLLAQHQLSESQWPSVLSTLEFCINDSVSQSTSFTPFFLVYGQHPNSLESSSKTLPLLWDQHLHQATAAIQKAQDRQARLYNLNRSPFNPQVGDLVLLQREGINWAASSQSSKRLLSPWLGPFKVLSLDGLNATLELPVTTKIHNVFSVSKLKKYSTRPNQSIPSPDLINGEEEWEVDSILDHRFWRKHLQYLVHFKGFNKDAAQWLFAADLPHCQDSIDLYLSTRGGVASSDKVADSHRSKLKLRLPLKE